MTDLPRICAFVALTLMVACTAFAQLNSATGKAVMSTHAKGSFEVKMTPQGEPDSAEGISVSRMLVEKQFHGDLEATSKGEMLAAGTEVKNSAGYVLIERVTGKLNGRTGSFALQHTGTMNRGAPQLSITVVPDSGSGQLVGLTGKLSIEITNGKHFYDFEYTLPEQQ